MDPVTIGEILFSIDDKNDHDSIVDAILPVGSKMIDGDTLSQTKIAMDMMYVKRLTGIGR